MRLLHADYSCSGIGYINPDYSARGERYKSYNLQDVANEISQNSHVMDRTRLRYNLMPFNPSCGFRPDQWADGKLLAQRSCQESVSCVC